MPGQPQPGTNPWITFDVTNLTVTEAGDPSNLVIETNRPFDVNVSFVFGGSLADWIVSMGLNCDLEVTAERLGPGVDHAHSIVTPPTVVGTLNYTETVNIPAGALPVGRYKIVGAVTVQGAPPPPMAGYVEGPIIQIIQP